MPTIASSAVPPPKSWDEFEDIAHAASKLRWPTGKFFRNGRQGQKQDGVDIWGDHGGFWIGVQCKNSIGGIDERLVRTEVENAENFTPKLSQLYVATTSKRDGNLQKAIRIFSEERCRRGLFAVDILFWDDIFQDLAKDDDVFFSHYPQFQNRIDPVVQHDQELFNAVIELLKSDGVIGFLDRTNMAGFSFRLNSLDPLYDFYYKWDQPEREFIIQELDSLRKQMWQKTEEYLDIIGYQTFPTHRDNFQHVPPEWEYEQPDRFNKVVTALHSLAKQIVELHAKFVRTGRSILIGTTTPK